MADRTSADWLFQSRGPAVAHDRSLTVTHRDRRTSRRLEVINRPASLNDSIQLGLGVKHVPSDCKSDFGTIHIITPHVTKRIVLTDALADHIIFQKLLLEIVQINLILMLYTTLLHIQSKSLRRSAAGCSARQKWRRKYRILHELCKNTNIKIPLQCYDETHKMYSRDYRAKQHMKFGIVTTCILAVRWGNATQLTSMMRNLTVNRCDMPAQGTHGLQSSWLLKAHVIKPNWQTDGFSNQDPDVKWNKKAETNFMRIHTVQTVGWRAISRLAQNCMCSSFSCAQTTWLCCPAVSISLHLPDVKISKKKLNIYRTFFRVTYNHH